ncbi:Fanconi anemia core complex-associated protein 100 [Mastacembelus armatus]|uniref:Fanconi anemia core complex-associated protein 100 n=1 Tax=Mastacembelus armatus TaxID=205130 RepID=UPI000E457715|nr:Fanconi anemia core complex-associated protein 100 [Mastacembelus armatus]
MEGRCVVETWAEFGFSGPSYVPRLRLGFETAVFLCTGSDEVYIFSTQERKLTAVLQFPGPVSDLAESPDKQLLYVSCRGGVYCVSLPLLLSRAQNSLANVSSGLAELKISPEFLAVEEEEALSLLLVGSVLLILSQRDASWVLSLYKTPKQTQSCSYEMISSFSLPLVSAVVSGDSELKTGVKRRPVLTCVHSGHTTPASSGATSSTEAILTDSHFHLEPVLFKLLFGIDAALIRSPVIVCGLPDGRLCFLPLRLPGSQLRVLYSLEQPVVSVGASVVMETGPAHAQCLVAVGELGRVVLIRTDKGGPEGPYATAGFIEGSVPGPVVCGCVDKHHFYYSTGSDLLVLDLSERSSEIEGQDGDETSSKSAAALQSPSSLNVCRVVSLAEPPCSTADEVQLLALSVRGQLQRITLPVGLKDARIPKLPSTQVGRSVKDLLSAIGDVCDRASVLKISIKTKNQTLRHLNQVLNISFLLIARKNNEDLPIEEKPMRCHAITRWSRLLQKDSLNLTCVLDNSSPYVLERGWTLSITICPLSYSPSVGGENSSTTFSFPFCNLHPGETLEVSLPLGAAGESSFPMTVNSSLIFSLTSLLGEEAVASFAFLQSNCISLPLNSLTVDWLHTLQLSSLTVPHKNNMSNADDTIQAFLNSRQIRCSGRGEGGVETVVKHVKEQYSASVRVSSDLLGDTLGLKGSDMDPQGPNLAPQNICISLLNWLFEGHGGVKMEHQVDKTTLSSSVVLAQAPSGDTVKISSKEVNIMDSAMEEDPLTAVEVQVESSSIAAVCGLHHAVLHRVQTLLHRAPERAASIKRVQSLGIRQALQRAERLLQQIQQNRISEAFGVGVSTGQTTRSLLSVYRELRENPLLII